MATLWVGLSGEIALLRNVVHPEFSSHYVGWVASAAVHVAGGLAAWMMVAETPAVNPNLAGRTSPVKLTATWQGPVEDRQLEEPPKIDAQVLIGPRQARVAEHTLVLTDTGVPKPYPAVAVERIVRSPPPPIAGRIGQPDQSDLAGNAPPPAVSRRLPPAPEISPAAMAIPRSLVENPLVGTDMETPPHPLRNIPPTYPAQAVVNRWEGTVILRLDIADNGSVTNVEMASSSGHHILDVEAIRSVRKWRFAPAKRAGQAVAATVRLPVRFVLETD